TPRPQAVCCKDHEHCCPWGYTCNVVAQSCEKRRPREPPAPTPLQGARSVPAAPVPCDTAHACPSGQKCCAGPHGSWGCCPFAEGSCCSDGRHCCPAGSLCALGSCRPLRWDVA
ncbi:GRN protein, partial [Nothocercus nigrocapillus]|nr:GRN protein [Nothocercus nigrocapillus]